MSRRKIAVSAIASLLMATALLAYLNQTQPLPSHGQELGTPVFLPLVNHHEVPVAPSATPMSTPEPAATSPARPGRRTPTPTATLALPAPAPSTKPNWYDTAFGEEKGMSQSNYYKLIADSMSGAFDRLCSDTEHDVNQWHSLLNYESGCHFDHHHGDDPYGVSDIFGEPGAWYGESGRSVAYPWQTFNVAADEDDPNVQPPDGALYENVHKHEGYIWIVRRGQTCAGGSYCVKDFRLQLHFMSTHDAPVRWHSFSFEGRLCRNVNDASTCGFYRLGGWMDYARLFVPPLASGTQLDCWVSYNGALEGVPDQQQYVPYILNLANYDQFYRPEVDQPPLDELRCHKQISQSQVSANPRGFARAAEWWGHNPFDFRYQVRVWNPHGNVNSDGTIGEPFCATNDPVCRWTFSKMTAELDYVVPVHRSLDSNRDGLTDFTAWINRLGGSNSSCTAAGLNCIPASIEGVPINPNGIGYNHDLGWGEPWDYDVTPIGRPSWITWFHHYGH